MAESHQSVSSRMAARTGQLKGVGVVFQTLEARLGARLAALRKKAGIAIESIGAQTGIGAVRMHEIEAGLVRAEAIELYDIALCLNASISDIFAGIRRP